MKLAEQWRRIEADLPADWADARLELAVGDDAQRVRAAALLGPASPGRTGSTLCFQVSRRGAGTGPDAVERLLARLDRERIRGTLTTLDSAAAEPAAPAERSSLAEAFDAELAALPPDWSDLYAEVELTSSDLLDRGALLLAPLNPARHLDRLAFRFRVARVFGYGASGPMTRRCLERLDEDGIPGTVTVLRALSDTHNVATQGPVWYVEGKAV